jgi:hypothetical protein
VLQTTYLPAGESFSEGISFFGRLDPGESLIFGSGTAYIGFVPGVVEEATWTVRSSP